jgi:hypothetical protein
MVSQDERVAAGTAHGCNGAPVVAVRHRGGPADQGARAVHLVALPVRPGVGAVGALCGALLPVANIETLEPGEGMPCTMCLLYRTRTRPSEQAPAAEDRRLLTLGGTTTALLIPLDLVGRVQAILAARSCPVPILIHPDAPEHRVFVTGDPTASRCPGRSPCRWSAARSRCRPLSRLAGRCAGMTRPTGTGRTPAARSTSSARCRPSSAACSNSEWGRRDPASAAAPAAPPATGDRAGRARAGPVRPDAVHPVGQVRGLVPAEQSAIGHVTQPHHDPGYLVI